ncbi:MAG: cytochrome b/b6 domain-containing protein [Magnetococcales bacterium]|nr:cytochrome b/b6 domain-containing protein [Magnetococcales bacterium]
MVRRFAGVVILGLALIFPGGAGPSAEPAPAPVVDGSVRPGGGTATRGTEGQSANSTTTAATIVQRHAITDRHCQECHGVTGYAVPTGKHGETPLRSLFVDGGKLKESVHGRLTCLDCHSDINQLPHKRDGLARVDCLSCHQKLHREPEALVREMSQGRAMVGLIPSVDPTPIRANQVTREYAASLHGRLRGDGSRRENAACQECHGAHDIFPVTSTASRTHRLASPRMCGHCHAKPYEQYRMSVHGAALLTPWKGQSAVCSDCHPSHRIESSKLPAGWREITESCGDCHRQALESYLSTYHGQLAWLGDKKAAKCSDCHNSHATHRVDDPADRAHPDRRLATCRSCHKEATPGFALFQPHANTRDFKRYPWMWLAGKGMALLVLCVLGFFYLHSYLWFRRARRERVHGHEPATPMPLDSGDRTHYRRFSWPWRVNHWLLALSVMTLTLTGMTARYADSVWAQWIAGWIGDPVVLARIHRVAAVIFLLAVGGHAVAALHNVLVRRRGTFHWFGPDSLLPRLQDWHDMKAQFRWFLGRGAPPNLDQWTYWEKFDYWAVYWGALVVGLSGLILWFSELFARFLPGWVFNLANLLHGVEAFLAVTTLFVVHFFNNHFRPGKFPLDIVMFTGSWSLEELQHERPAAYRRLLANGELQKRLVPPPSRRAWILAHVAGFLLISIGLLLLMLVLLGFLKQGLV